MYVTVHKDFHPRVPIANTSVEIRSPYRISEGGMLLPVSFPICHEFDSSYGCNSDMLFDFLLLMTLLRILF
jgi:hypothetical protein